MVLIIDNFIKDESLLSEINTDASFFSDPGEYYFWSGWWDSPANTTKKKLIKHIWGDAFPLNMVFDTVGFEYWTGIQTADPASPYNDNLEAHFDKDEELFKLTGELQKPLIGCIYYPQQSEFEGGMLEIFTEGMDKDPERIYARSNRLIIFDAGNLAHRVSQITKGTRRAIAISLWGEDPYSNKMGILRTEK